MPTIIHPKNVHEKSPKRVHKMSTLFSQDVTYYVHEMSATHTVSHNFSRFLPDSVVIIVVVAVVVVVVVEVL